MSPENEFLEIYLDRLLKALLAGKDPVRLRGEAIISFDRNYRAFIPITKGFNKVEDRLYLESCSFIKDLGAELNRERINREEIDGGRIFINKKGAFLKQEKRKFVKFSELSIRFPKCR